MAGGPGARPLRPISRNFSQFAPREWTMRLTFIGKDPLANPTGSPTVYTTDERTLLVQGWVIGSGAAREGMKTPAGEDAGESPIRMLPDILRRFLQRPGPASGAWTIS